MVATPTTTTTPPPTHPWKGWIEKPDRSLDSETRIRKPATANRKPGFRLKVVFMQAVIPQLFVHCRRTNDRAARSAEREMDSFVRARVGDLVTLCWRWNGIRRSVFAGLPSRIINCGGFSAPPRRKPGAQPLYTN